MTLEEFRLEMRELVVKATTGAYGGKNGLALFTYDFDNLIISKIDELEDRIEYLNSRFSEGKDEMQIL